MYLDEVKTSGLMVTILSRSHLLLKRDRAFSSMERCQDRFEILNFSFLSGNRN